MNPHNSSSLYEFLNSCIGAENPAFSNSGTRTGRMRTSPTDRSLVIDAPTPAATQVLQPKDLNVAGMINPKVRTVSVQFQTGGGNKSYTYLTESTEIEVGKYVIVPVSGRAIHTDDLKTRGDIDPNLAADSACTQEWVVARVVGIQEGYVPVKDYSYKLRWVISLVYNIDLKQYAETLGRDAKILAEMEAAVEKEAADTRRQREIDAIPQGSKAAIWDIMGVVPVPPVPTTGATE